MIQNEYDESLIDALFQQCRSKKLVEYILKNNLYEYYPGEQLETISKELGNKLILDNGIKYRFNQKGVTDAVLTHLYTLGYKNIKNGILKINLK
jgi:hypothetical protein